MGKSASLLVAAVLLASSFLFVVSVNAQMQKPSTPEFTMHYVDYSYAVQPSYTVNQYTGQTVTSDQVYPVDNRTVEFTIKNQPFTPYTDSSGNHIHLYYNFHFKGTYGTEWANYPDTSHTYGIYSYTFPDTSASKTAYTTILIPISALTCYPAGTPVIPSGVQLEFQLQAIEGYINSESTGMMAGSFMDFAGERSDWSSTQTVTLGENFVTSAPTVSASENPTMAPMQQETQTASHSEFEWQNIAITVLAAALTGTIFIAVFMKRK